MKAVPPDSNTAADPKLILVPLTVPTIAVPLLESLLARKAITTLLLVTSYVAVINNA